MKERAGDPDIRRYYEQTDAEADRLVRSGGWSAGPGGEVGEVEARGDHAADQDLLSADRPG
jgi:hypothetical protein